MLSGYAKQAAMITPEMINGVARDLRLGVVSLEQKNNGGARLSEELEQKELLLAVKTLLEVRDRLQQAGGRAGYSRNRFLPHEQYL